MNNDELVERGAYVYWRNGKNPYTSDMYQVYLGTFSNSLMAEKAYNEWVENHPVFGMYCAILYWGFE